MMCNLCLKKEVEGTLKIEYGALAKKLANKRPNFFQVI
jgi:hypothetical protein